MYLYRDEEVKFSGRGVKNYCSRNKTHFKSFKASNLATCFFCRCFCDDHSDSTDSHFNLRPVTSDVQNNK